MVPQRCITQPSFLHQYSEFTEDVDIRRKINFIGAKSGIDHRYTVCENLQQIAYEGISKRMKIFKKEALDLSIKAIKNLVSFEENKEKFTDLIFVTCTGLTAPGIEFDLIDQLTLPTNVQRHTINFMGCYAGITAMKMANLICEKPNKKVLIICVELCTIHFQPFFSNDHILSNILFADGASSAIVSSEKEPGSMLEILDFETHLIPDSAQQMSWNLSEKAFLMTLSAEVPISLEHFLQNQHLFQKSPSETNWILHPGGKKIIEGIQKALKLPESEVNHSLEVLKNYGNMSSATIWFTIQAYFNKDAIKKLEIIGMAFGPGLTLESFLLKNVQ